MTSFRSAPFFASPGDPKYMQAVAAFNSDAVPAPAAAVVATSTFDVTNAVVTACNSGWGVRAMATGHAARSMAPMTGELLIRTRLEGPVVVDPAARTARIPAGTPWQTVVDAAAPHGLIALHGSSGTVGAVGYLLRGGLSFYGRLFGLASNAIRSITVVIATGETRTVSEDTVPELFWALRGGGGGLGIVTEIEIDLFPMANIYTGQIAWHAADAAVIAPLWKAWTATAPLEATTSLRLLTLPPMPGITPAALTSGQILMIDGAISIERASDLPAAMHALAALLDPLRAAVTPIFDTWAIADPAALLLTHLDPPLPLPYVADHLLLTDLDSSGLLDLLRVAGHDSPSSLLACELRHLGGRFAHPVRDGGALDRLHATFAYFGLGVLGGPATRAQLEADLATVRATLEPWDTGFTAPTFVETREQPQRTLTDRSYERVAAIRATIDPHGTFARDVSPVHSPATVA